MLILKAMLCGGGQTCKGGVPKKKVLSGQPTSRAVWKSIRRSAQSFRRFCSDIKCTGGSSIGKGSESSKSSLRLQVQASQVSISDTEDIFYDALTRISDAEDIFYDALTPDEYVKQEEIQLSELEKLLEESKQQLGEQKQLFHNKPLLKSTEHCLKTAEKLLNDGGESVLQIGFFLKDRTIKEKLADVTSELNQIKGDLQRYDLKDKSGGSEELTKLNERLQACKRDLAKIQKIYDLLPKHGQNKPVIK